mmetsp:Transcript_9651/g.14347  ORF Transcript_9651/g.14347 Transcript_9651/m.14347 type:complete len:228 (+) Transcript_9651:76-759(+)|eukprot:CAMPEP_0194764184 /NCGR_PEP_ID=MMETSP0323_2-20130528/21508_1 /TAXON_ID=2866 ORGANISM="Crypthecodinium cohnii, Strain Seligo" /NCGR_SAMPLE_ID=MMETSP0323_2 /ASSEMBLY_ACC=CAM_ASM_000346 /LENGTH=227 /DNA_ID=CAMNT_0039690727 /DNA_START=71 /DNA_END=754 /DNA_ORIENTATION=+
MAAAAKNKLFIGNLPSGITTEEVQMVFNTYGPTSDVHIMQGRASSGQSCAFVVYESADAAQQAITALNGIYSFREDGSPPITVSWARQGPPQARGPPTPGYGAAPHMGGGMGGPQGGYGHGVVVSPPPQQQYAVRGSGTKLFVGNLPQDIQEEALRMVFGSYGTVTNIHIMGGKSKSGQACSFVEYSNATEAETAILTLHEKYEIRPGEGAILVKWANSGGARAAPY